MIRIAVQKDGYVIKGITSEQLEVLNYIIGGIDEKCYKEQETADNHYVSGDYFGVLPIDSRKALKTLSQGLKTAIRRL